MLYTFVQLSRAVLVAILYPGLSYFGYGLNWKEASMLVWAGLRGAVALSLSLSVAVSKMLPTSTFPLMLNAQVSGADLWHTSLLA